MASDSATRSLSSLTALTLVTDTLEHGARHRLTGLADRRPWILAQTAQPLGDIADVEVIEADIGVELLPCDRRRHRRLGAGADRVRRDRSRAFGIAQVIDENLPLALRLGQRRDEPVGECADQQIR